MLSEHTHVIPLSLEYRWKQVLLAFSFLATCSVADCERKHADHKRLCSNAPSTGFMSMLINSVNDELKHLSMRLQNDAKKRWKDYKSQLQLQDDGSGIGSDSRTAS